MTLCVVNLHHQQKNLDCFDVSRKVFVVIVVFYCLIFQDRVSVCIPGCPGTCFVDKDSLKVTEIHLRLPPESRDERPVSPSPNSFLGHLTEEISSFLNTSGIILWAGDLN